MFGIFKKRGGRTSFSVPHGLLTSYNSSHYTTNTDAWGLKTIRNLPLIGKWQLYYQYLFGAVLIIFGLIATTGLYVYSQFSQEEAFSKHEKAKLLSISLESMAKDLQKIINGKTNVFNAIKTNHDEIDNTLNFLAKNTSSHESLLALQMVQNDWSVLSQHVNKVLENKHIFEDFAKNQKAILNEKSQLNKAIKRFVDLAMKKETDKYTRQRIIHGLFYLWQIEQTAMHLTLVDEPFHEGQFLITKNTNQFKKFLEDLEKENGDFVQTTGKIEDKKILTSFTQLKNTFDATLSKSAAALSNNALLIQLLKNSANVVLNESDKFLANLTLLANAYDNEKSKSRRMLPLASISFIIMLFGLGLIVLIYTNEERRIEIESRATVSRNQQAVMQLLNEIDPIREGDLTHKVTVLDEFTATIADAINATIEDLSDLVKGVKSSSNETVSAAKSMSLYSKEALKFSAKLVKSVINAAYAVLKVENKLQVLMQRAEETSQFAMLSLNITNEGNKTVTESLESMRAIQSRVGNTKNRVLRLKDMSVQIEEILGTIRDITEKTNVLAINANLEAKRAGTTGKGFTVVAQSVQDLAQQATEATRKIGALINSVQSDIDEAAKFMNDTAMEIESAAKRAEIAGEAFIKIEKASHQLANIIDTMSKQVLEQVEESIQIRHQMNDVVDIVKSTNRMNETANKAAEEVETLMVKLIRSTERFKIV